MNTKPEVAIVTMAFNPMLRMHSIINAIDQTYEPRTLHLMHQKPWPNPLVHDGIIKIHEHYVQGTWPAVWYFKLKTFVDNCDSPLFAIMDEDDRFEPTYLEFALSPILKDEAKLAWNHHNLVVKNDILPNKIVPVIQRRYYRSGIGTLVGLTNELKRCIILLGRKYPKGLTGKGGGPVDAKLKKIIDLRDPVEHTGMRRYFYHMNTNTKGYRDERESVDFGSARRTVLGRFRPNKPKRKKRG